MINGEEKNTKQCKKGSEKVEKPSKYKTALKGLHILPV